MRHTIVARILSAAVGVVSSLCLFGTVAADAPRSLASSSAGKQGTQPRLLGKKAVMHVYYFAPQTLEITSVTSQLFRDLSACERAADDAVEIAIPRASAGDLVGVQCVSMDPPDSAPQSGQRSAPRDAITL